jgi:L-fuconolactonase
VRVDAHQHFWHFDPVRDAWITPAMEVLRRHFLPPDSTPLLRAAQIDAVVAVQADQSEAETDFLLALARDNSIVRGVVGWVDLRATDLAARVARWGDEPLLKGFRHIAQAEPDDFLARDDVVTGIQAIGALGYSYDLLVYPRQLPAAALLAARCQDVTLVLDHCGKPPIASGDLRAWEHSLRALAAFGQVSCKLSGLVTEASWSTWREDAITPVLDVAFDAFGAGRLMFGSDWPVCLLAADYPRVVESVARWSEQLPPADRDAIFGGSAAHIYRLTTES